VRSRPVNSTDSLRNNRGYVRASPRLGYGVRYPNIRLCNPATFFNITVCRDRGFRYRSAAIRQTFIFPIPCSATTRSRATRRFPALCRRVNGRPRGFRIGTRNRVPK
jgi:hypothetical protein